jgi:hypothetical protein
MHNRKPTDLPNQKRRQQEKPTKERWPEELNDE